MRKSELIDIRNNLDSFSADEIKEILINLIDVVAGTEKPQLAPDAPPVAHRKKRKHSKSMRLKMDEKIWPEELHSKYADACLSERRNHIYATYIDPLTKETIQCPVSHLVWAEKFGQMPYKGKRLRHIDGDTMNNQFNNLHPEDGVYQ